MNAYEFVEHDLGAEQLPRCARFVPRHVEQIHDGRKDVTEDQLETQFGMVEQPADPAQNPVGERDERHEREHHRRHRDRNLYAGLRAVRRRHDDVGGAFLLRVPVGEADRVVLLRQDRGFVAERQLALAGAR